MQRNYLLMLSGVVLLMAACQSQAVDVEETPPPAAAVGDEAPPDSMADAPPAPEAPPPAAAPPEPPKPTPPTVGAVVVHRVKDYDAWLMAFNENEDLRMQSGIVGHGVSLDADKKNTVVVYLGSNDLSRLKGFIASKELKAAMKEAGVQGKPSITYMKHVASRPAEDDVALTLMVTHKVEDFAAWQTAFDAHGATRAAAGVIGESVSQDPDDANLVYVYLQGSDAEKLRAFAKDKELKAAMKEAGVKGKPAFTFMTPEAMEFYPPGSAQPAAPEAPPAPPGESAVPAPAPAPAG